MGYNLEQSTDYVNRDPVPSMVRHDSDCAQHNMPAYPNGRRNCTARFLSKPPGPLNTLSRDCHAANQHWWHHPATGERLNRNKGELLMLIVSEVAEAMEGERKNLMDDKLPHRKMAEVELADVLIRVFDYAGAYGFDLDGAVAEKRAFNATRADHKAEARLAPGGKAF